MNSEKTWAYCPKCGHTQRFMRVAVNHLFHALMTVVTLGLWSISWIAAIIGARVTPWRCKHCGCNNPDFTRVDPTKRRRRAEPRPEPDAAQG